MAFTPETLSLIVEPVGGVGLRMFSYRSDDAKASMVVPGYIDEASVYGLREDDLIFVSQFGVDEDPFILVVESIDALDAATLVFGDTFFAEMSDAGRALLAAADEDAQRAILGITEVADRTELVALDTTKQTRAYLRETGREGPFVWDGSNLASSILGASQVAASVSASTNTITITDHGALPGDAFIVTAAVNGFSTNTLYYAIVPLCWKIHFNTQTANFTVGQTLTGAGGATGTIVDQDDDGTNGILWLENVTGTFVQGEVITDGAGGSATADDTTELVLHPNKLKLATSFANAVAGTAVDITSSAAMTIRRHLDPHQGLFVTPAAAINGSSGAWCRTERRPRMVSPTWFGMAESNTGAANAAALKAALNYNVFLPPGTFELAGKIYARPKTIIGSGRGVTSLYWKDTASSAGMEIYFTDDRAERCNLADFTMLTNDTGTAARAIYLNGAARLVGTGNNGVVDMGSMERVEMNGITAPSTAGWRSGFHAHEMINYLVKDCSFNGYTSNGDLGIVSTFGFRTTSTSNGAGSVVEFHDCRAMYALIGGDTDTVEGTKFFNCTFVAVRRGIRAIKTQTKVAPYIAIEFCHINARYRAIEIDSWQQLDIRGNAIYQRPNADEAGAGIAILGCRDAVISGNMVSRNGNTGFDFNGVLIKDNQAATEDSVNIQVYGNNFRDTTYGVWFQPGTTTSGAYKNKIRRVVNTSAELYLDTSSDATNWFGNPRYSGTNAGVVNAVVNVPTALCTASPTIVHVKQIFDVFVQVRLTKGGTDGLTHLIVAKSAGTASVNFNHSAAEIRHSPFVPASGVPSVAFAGTMEVTAVGASNTLTVQLSVNSFGSGADVDAGAAEIILIERD